MGRDVGLRNESSESHALEEKELHSLQDRVPGDVLGHATRASELLSA